jgi:hypothetical protein
MSYIPPDPRHQIPGYLEGEVARLRERNSKNGLSGMPTIAVIFGLPFLLLYKGGKSIFRLFKRS